MKKSFEAIVLTVLGIITLPYGIVKAYNMAMNALRRRVENDK